MNVHAFMPAKEHPDLPDAYGLEIFFYGEKEPLSVEVSEHRIIDKIYQPDRQAETGEIVFRLVGAAPVPLLEYTTKDDFLETIPLSSIRRLRFDKRYSEIRAIREEMDKEKK